MATEHTPRTCGTGEPSRQSHHSEKLKSNLTSRLNRIEGQVRGVKRMIDEDVYCDDVLNVIASIQSALNGVGTLLLENHLKSCVVEQLRDNDPEIMDELMQTIRRMMK
ncbi:MAG: metal-sensitive transcriptional regulator [Bacteroidota bacterium]|jgi:DNA-binding FrmR family transcriptional regulator|nr:metal-sensitive transcriptional regulator [Bacteroidota bacterium]